MNGSVQLFHGKPIPGPYTQSSRESWLTQLLEAQTWIRENGPEYVRHLELITLLLEHGASASAVRSDGRSLADLAAVGSPYPEDRVGSFLARGAVVSVGAAGRA